MRAPLQVDLASGTGTKTTFHDALMEGRADSETDPYECVLEERATTEDALHDYLLEGRTERFEGLMLLAEGDLGDKLSVWCAVGGPAASFAC